MTDGRQQQNERSLPGPADAFFKETFSHLPSTRSFLQNYLPPALVAQTDWPTLQREAESFLDAELRSRYADLLFSCRLGGKKAFYYVLLEHKSQPEFWTTFYLLEVMVRIWRKRLDNSGYGQTKLPLIVPVVLHQGPRKWNFPASFGEYLDWPGQGREELGRHNPDFTHVLVDLSELPLEEIKGEARLRLAMSLMKAVRENRVLEILPRIAPLMAELGSAGSTLHFLQALARYMMETEERLNVSTIHQLADKLPTQEAKSQVMTLAQYIREEGREEGLELGLEKGREEGRQEGRQEGREQGVLVGRILQACEMLDLPYPAGDDLKNLSLDELQQRLAVLQSRFRRDRNS